MSHFFALISRMKYINRWALMRNTRAENLSEHAQDVAVIAHALAVIGNRRFGKNYNPERAATLGLYHDACEILTGDMPTPVKYYNPEIKNAYKQVEGAAKNKILSSLPDDLKGDYESVLKYQANELAALIKASDKIAAYIKCIEEGKSGNGEFGKAAEAILNSIKEMNLPEANCFIEEFIPSFSLTLDELEL